MNDATVDDLLAAYALNACEPSEALQVERYLAEHPAAAAELAKLSTAAAWIGATEALTPPPRLRDDLLAVARARNTRSASDDALELFRDQTDQLDALVGRLRADDLSAPTANGLSVRDLLVHLAAMETMVAAGVRHTDPAIVPSVDIEGRTAAFIEVFALRPLDEVRSVWRRAVEEIADWAVGGEAEGHVPWLPVALPRDTIIVIRSFETWIHADDIRRALGLELESPRPAHLHRMANFSMQSLPAWLEVSGRPHPGRAARIVLTGAGGGSWLVPLALGEANVAEAAGVESVDVVLEVDIVDWCHRVAERISPDAIAVRVAGPTDLAGDLAVDILEAASTLATL